MSNILFTQKEIDMLSEISMLRMSVPKELLIQMNLGAFSLLNENGNFPRDNNSQTEKE